jgi:exopolysaccharide biosynthesis protein
MTTSASALREYLFPTHTFANGTTIILDKLKGLYIIKPTQRERFFSASWSKAPEVAKVYSGVTNIINASYFGYANKAYFPAGHASHDPAPIDPVHCQRDKNLCGFVFTDTLTITEGLKSTNQPTISWGPILLRKWKINNELTQKYSHRQQKTQRTVLLNTSRGNFFVVTKKWYTLPDLSAYLLKTFGRSTTAINLDGGSSTMLRSTATGFSYHADATLPSYFILQ